MNNHHQNPTIFSVVRGLALAASMSTSLFAAASGTCEVADTVVCENNVRSIVVMESGDSIMLHCVYVDGQHTLQRLSYSINISETPGGETIDVPSDIKFQWPFVSSGDNGSCDSCAIATARQPVGAHGVKRRRSRISFNWFALRGEYFGWLFNYGSSGAVKNSYEAGFAQAVGGEWRLGRRGPRFSIGLGVGVRQFLAADGLAYVKTGEQLSLRPVDGDSHTDYSRLKSWSFQVPVSLRVPLSQSFLLSVGAIANFNTYAVAETRMISGDTRYTINMKGLHQQLLTVDLTAGLGFDNAFGVYVRWSPNTLFQSCYGPEFRTFSIGGSVAF